MNKEGLEQGQGGNLTKEHVLPANTAENAAQNAPLLAEMSQKGWQETFVSASDRFGYAGAASDVARALMEYWEHEPSLENYARQLDGALSLFHNEKQKGRLIATMNLAYIQTQKDLPQSLADCYAELLFWDDCDMPEARAYFDRLGARFAYLCAKESKVGAALGELLRTRQLTPQMKQVRRLAVDELRENLRGRLAMQKSPVTRLQTLLDIAADVGGARVVNENLWQMVSQSVEQTAKASVESYIALRSMLDRAADLPLLDHPRETLAKINRLIENIDQSADYGRDFDAGRMLQYWRMQGFSGIPDDPLIALYQKFLNENPNGFGLIQKDKSMLSGRDSKRIKAFFNGEELESGNKDGRRSDGFSGRSQKKDGFDRKKWMYAAIVVAIVLILTIIWLMLPHGGGSKLPSVTPESTKERTASPQVSKESSPSATPEENTAKATPTMTQTPEVPKTPEVTPTPELTPRVTENVDEIIQEEELIEVPEDEIDVFMDEPTN